MRSSSATEAPSTATSAYAVLVIEDERSMSELLQILLEKEGHQVSTASTLDDAMQLVTEETWDLVVTDLWLDQDKDGGVQILQALRANAPDTPSLVITAHGSVNTAIEAMKLGAYDYLVKPFNNDELRLMVQKALEQRELRKENIALSEALGKLNNLDQIIGTSQGIVDVKELVQKVAALSSTVLILGESGTGKELVAKAIHTCSPRSNGPFLSINCGGLPEGLLESELFGHAKGAFTGAVTDKEGLFKAAHGGTLFLDEIGETSLALQVKLLRALDSMMIRPVGSNEEFSVDVRVVSATNRDLEQMVRDGDFREDFFYRLNVIPIVMPPLRDRRDDVVLLAHHFISQFSQQLDKPIDGFTDGAMDALQRYNWPGNVREFVNIMERTIALCTGSKIDATDLPAHVTRPHSLPGRRASDLPPEGINLEDKVAEYEQQLIRQALTMSDNSQVNAARLLGLSPRSLRYKLEKYNMKG